MFYCSDSTDIPRNWREANDFFADRKFKDRDYRNLKAANTSVRLIQRGAEMPAYAIRLYNTDIIIYYPDGRVFLDAYQSSTTNDRRDSAGVASIRTAQSMMIPKADYLEHRYRWDTHQSFDYQYGLPALDLLFGPTGQVEEIDGRPIDQFVEHVKVAKKDAQKWRRGVLRRTRALLEPHCRMLDSMDAETVVLQFNADDCEELLAKIDKGGDKDALIAEFVSDNDDASKFVARRGYSVAFLHHEIRSLMPAQNKDDRTLWEYVPVHPRDLPEYLA